MARINHNLLVNTASGNVGKQFVYRRRGNGTHIARMPVVNKKAKATADQEHTRELFAEASLYAQGAITDPALKLEYQKKATPGGIAFNRAIQDYFKSSEVKSIDASAFDFSIDSVI